MEQFGQAVEGQAQLPQPPERRPRIDPSVCKNLSVHLCFCSFFHGSMVGLNPECQNFLPQGGENEGGTGDATGKRKRGAGGGAEEQRHGVPAKANEEGQRRGEDEAKATVAICKKGDGKGWRCKREAQRGCSLCQYHLAKLRSYSRKKKRTEAATSPPEAPAAATGDTGRLRAARRRRTADGEPGESKGAVLSGGFYYYSGFGPRWGRSRRDRAVDAGRADDGGDSRARRHGDRSDDGDAGAGVEEDYGHGDANGDGKPSKSRSLASLL